MEDATQTTSIAQSELQCANCGGQCLYAPASQDLVCESCGTHTAIDPGDIKAARREFDYDPDAPRREPPDITKGQVHQCQTCGGSVLFAGPALSERCAYCDGPIVRMDVDEGYKTMALIPFQVEGTDVMDRAIRWVKGRKAAPRNLARAVEDGRIAGLYAPFFTFDSTELIHYWGRYTVRRGKHRVSRTKKGKFRTTFNDLLVPASPHITPLIRDGVLHDFQPSTLRPYTAAYLAGFAAERHHLSVAEGLDAKQADKKLLIRNRIFNHARRTLSDLKYQTDTSGLRYRRILLPVWMLHYEHRGKAYKIVVCGLNGTTYGERPYSLAKLFGYSAALTAAVLAFGLVWGALGIL